MIRNGNNDGTPLLSLNGSNTFFLEPCTKETPHFVQNLASGLIGAPQ